MSNMIACNFCEYSNPDRMNKDGEIRCTLLHEFVIPYSSEAVCEDYTGKLPKDFEKILSKVDWRDLLG